MATNSDTLFQHRPFGLFCVVLYNVYAQFKDQPYAFFYSRYTIKSIKENKEKIEALDDTI